MKRTKLILGSIAITAVLGGLYLNNNVDTLKERTYFSEEMTGEEFNSWSAASEYLNSLYINPITGQREEADYEAALQQALSMNREKAATFVFEEDGPDNVGGRTRAIIVDPNDDFTIYAGNVTGGMYKSTNGGNSWSRLTGWDSDASTLSVSSVCMTTNGTLYVGTGGGSLLGEGGLDFEGSGMQDGDGIWYSTDGGTSFQQLTGTSGASISRVAADLSKSDVFYFTGSSQALKRVTNKGIPESLVANGIQTSLSTVGVAVSYDGNVIICTGGTRVYVSTDGGNSFQNCVGSGTVTTPIANGGNRKECAISYEKNSSGKFSLYMAEESGGQMRGIWYSGDQGENWYKIGPASANGWTPCISANGQCYYDMVIDAVPGYPDHCIFGGIDLYRLRKTPGTADSDVDWSREQITQWDFNRNSPQYVHADNHRFTWDSNGALYVGNDGGMSKSFDNSTTFFTVINKGYNATQYYGIGFGPNGETIGGAQDNGTSYNDHTSLSGASYAFVAGGDGFECEISHLSDGEALLRTIYGGSLARSPDKGAGWYEASAPGAGSGFYNAVRLFEDGNDMDTKDSIEFIPDSTMLAGSTVTYYSETFDLPLSYVLTEDLIVNWDTVIPATDSVLPNFDTIPGGVPYLYNPQPQDTAMLPDTKQSLCITQGDVVYITRDMMRFSSGISWWNLGVGGTAHSYEFSKDGNCVWIGTTGGVLTRVCGLDSAYSYEAADVNNRPVSGDTIIDLATGDSIFTGFATFNWSGGNYRYGNYNDSSYVEYKLWTTTVVSGGNIITDITTDANDLDRVAYSTGTTAGSVFLSSNATSPSPTFTNIGTGLPNYPVFGCEFIMNTAGSDIMLVGTEFGAYSTDALTAGTTWTPHTDETGMVPVYDVRQQWRDFTQGAKNPYEVFLGTHGRGIWTSGSYLSNGEQHEVIEDVKELSTIRVFPNPLSTEGNIAFELGARTDVEFKVYDLQGKVVNQIAWRNMNSGKHTMNFSVEKLPAGTYLVTLKAGSSTEVTKFIKY